MAIDYRKSAIPKDGKTPSRNRKARRRLHIAKQRQVRPEVVTRQHHLCLAATVSPICTRRIDSPHHLLRQSWEHENSTDIEVGLCQPDHDAAEDGRLRFHWDGPRPDANAKPGWPGWVRPWWAGRSREYRPNATGYRQPDHAWTEPGKGVEDAGDDQADGDS